MRGVAALAVVCGHAMTMRFGMGISIEGGLAGLYLLQGGVDVFFVISGFIIATSADEIGAKFGRRGALEFSFRRAIRLYPMYWLVLVAAIISSHWIEIFPRSAGLSEVITWKHLLSLTVDNWYVPPAWSLCYELYFYAAVALVIAITPWRVTETLLGLLAMVVFGDIIGINLSIYGNPIVLEFGLGVVIAFTTRRNIFGRPLPFSCVTIAVPFFVVGWYAFCVGASNGGIRLLTFGLGSGLLIYAALSAEANGARFPRWMQWLGAISYSLYITHHLLLTWLALYNPTWLPGPLQMIAWVVIAIALSGLLYRWIEKPLLRAMRNQKAKAPNSIVKPLATSPQ